MVEKTYKKKIKKLELSNDPQIRARCVLFNDGEDVIKSKNKKQFFTQKASCLTVTFEDNTRLVIPAPRFYEYDGATIPFGIGKGNMKLLIPSLYHDILCENKEIVKYDRNLSSKIFYYALLFCGVNKVKAWVMYLAVDFYQKFMGWDKK